MNPPMEASNVSGGEGVVGEPLEVVSFIVVQLVYSRQCARLKMKKEDKKCRVTTMAADRFTYLNEPNAPFLGWDRVFPDRILSWGSRTLDIAWLSILVPASPE